MRANTLGFRIPLFERDVFSRRRERAAAAVRQAGLDVLLVTIPENIYYLIGLDHFGYFAFHMLVIPKEGEPVLVARKMEHVTIGRDVPDLIFEGYGDNDDLPGHCVDVIRSAAGQPGRIGMEETSLYLIPTVALAVRDHFTDAEVVDATQLVTSHRLVQSPEELEITRQVASISDAMIEAAITAARAGVTERDVAKAAVAAMMDAGGEPPAFWPFVRATSRFNEDHTTWTDYPLQPGDALFLELSGSIGRYHAPMGRVVFIGSVPEGSEFVSGVCLDAFEAARSAVRPGVEAGSIYEAWQRVVDEAGLSHYRRHHCGYATGIGFPPSWSGNGVPRALRPGSDVRLAEGMVFHLMSWMMETGAGDYFVSDPVVITPDGGRRLTKTPQELVVV
ncbi:MAG TPA: Xaa-Pro peptidase family protein [Acidimicrobiia bacterium]|nr:Xaa-Pro peptidase family protein [Acidimicrobiia bacterium]